MHLNQIQSFLAITRTLNFTGAARQLGIPQSTISRQINDLERRLGVRLFYRTRRDVQLTDEGRAFLPYAKEIAEAADKGTRAVRQLHEGMTGRLSIASAPASSAFVAACLREFHLAHPDIAVDLAELSGGFTLMDDADDTHDIYFLYRDMLEDDTEYEWITTHRESIGIACPLSMQKQPPASAGKPSRNRSPVPVRPIPPEELSSMDFVLLSEEADPILYMQGMNYCRTHRFTPHVTNTFSDTSSVLLSLRSGMGASFLPASLARDLGPEGIAFAPLDDDSYAIPCAAAWRRSLLNPAAALFIDILKKKID